MKGFIVALFLLLALPISVLAADGTKFGSVDLQKVLSLSDAGKSAKEQLDKREGKYAAEKLTRETEIKELRSALESQSTLLTDSARSEKDRSLQQRLKEYKHFLKEAQEDLQGKTDEFVSRIMEDIIKVAQEYGRKNGYTAIMVKNETLIYLDPKADVSEEVLRAFNESKRRP